MLSMILATDLTGGIGNTDTTHKGLCWTVKEDMQRFIKLSKQYKQVIAGTTTYKLLQNLPERQLYRLTRTPDKHNDLSLSDLVTESQISDFLVIGGKQTFISVKPFCKRIYLSEIQQVFTNCTVFINMVQLIDGFTCKTKTTVKTVSGITVTFYVFEQ